MTTLAIPHNALVFVGDGQKALFLRSAGDEKFLNLQTERVFVDDNPPHSRNVYRIADILMTHH